MDTKDDEAPKDPGSRPHALQEYTEKDYEGNVS